MNINNWNDLAPTIVRQRLIIEGTLFSPMDPKNMGKYIGEIGPVLDMTPITSPILNHHPRYGWCAYMHWEESGIHMYSWDHHEPPFFSVDIYTCKTFDPATATNFTRDFFGKQLINLVWKD